MAVPHHRKQEQRADKESPVGERKNCDAADELNRCATWVVEQTEHQLARRARVFTQETRNTARAKLLHARQWQSNCLLKGCFSHARLNALA